MRRASHASPPTSARPRTRGHPARAIAPGEAFLLAQSDAEGAGAEADAIAAVFAAAGGRVSRSADAAAGERLLDIRRAMHPALAASGQVLIEDVAVPRSRLPEMFRAIEEIGRRYGIEIPTVAHAGDGNLHPNFVFTGDEVPADVWAAADDLFRAAVALGGTLTGEHGVGRAETPLAGRRARRRLVRAPARHQGALRPDRHPQSRRHVRGDRTVTHAVDMLRE